MKKIKFVIKLTMLLGGLSALVFAFLPERIPVDVAKAIKRDIFITIEGEGKTRIHDIYVVSTPIDGRITRLEIDAGDIVEAGKTVIANMYPANPNFLDKRSETQAKADVEGAKAALALANARVKQAQAQLEFERLDYERVNELFKKNSVSRAVVDRAELQMKTLRAELETSESNKEVMESRLRAAEAQLLQPNENEISDGKNECHICIHSPVNGRVLRIRHKSEGIVPVGTPLVEIGDPSDLEVILEILSSDAVKIQKGDRALIKHWGGESELQARVKLVEPSGFSKVSTLGVEEQRVNVILDLVDEKSQWENLGDAYRVEASIIIDSANQVLSIPLSSIFRENESWAVYKVVDGVAMLTQVTLGRKNDRWVEIIDGVVQGEMVIAYPGNKITDGIKVAQR